MCNCFEQVRTEDSSISIKAEFFPDRIRLGLQGFDKEAQCTNVLCDFVMGVLTLNHGGFIKHIHGILECADEMTCLLNGEHGIILIQHRQGTANLM